MKLTRTEYYHGTKTYEAEITPRLVTEMDAYLREVSDYNGAPLNMEYVRDLYNGKETLNPEIMMNRFGYTLSLRSWVTGYICDYFDDNAKCINDSSNTDDFKDIITD